MKRAFSMIELIIVIIVVGILAVTVLPRFGDNKLREAANQIISHFRYTQHLAMVNNKFNPSLSQWHLAQWQIYFHKDASGNGDIVYTIFSNEDLDTAGNVVETKEIANDPMTQKKMTGSSGYSASISSMNLTKKFGIVSYSICGASMDDKKRVYFDHLGRVYTPDGLRDPVNIYSELLHDECNITFRNSDNKEMNITISPETGYVRLTAVEDD